MQYRQYDIVTIDFPYIDKPIKTKIRPCVIVSSDAYHKNTGFYLVTMITSAKHSSQWGDYVIPNPQELGLIQTSIIRMKFCNIIEADIYKKLGRLSKRCQLILKERMQIITIGG